MSYLKTEAGITGGKAEAALAHEIRNPLALIRANLQYVELTDKKRKNKKNYEIIYREIDRINDILHSYMEACGPERRGEERFSVNALVDEIGRLFETPLAMSDIELRVLLDNESAELAADYGKMKQVLINAVQNAKESIEGKGGREKGLIEIRTRKRGRFAEIIITDNGAGISEDDLKIAGTPFFTRKKDGCGLGISISREIVGSYNGKFVLSGEENKGASVTITLPVCDTISAPKA